MEDSGYTCPKCGGTREFTADHIELWGTTTITEYGWNWDDSPHDALLADNARLTCDACGYEADAREFQNDATAEPFTTDYYTLVKTDNGWRADANDSSWQWFDFPDITFTGDECRFELNAEAIVMAGDLDTYREFLGILADEIAKLRQHINQ